MAIKEPYLALDLETTGLSPERDAIIEIGMVKFTEDRVLDTFTAFVNPRRKIPYQVEQLTGIKDADVAKAETIDKLLPRVKSFIGNAVIVGHTIKFDIDFLYNAGLRLRNRSIDTFALASILMPHAPRYGLGVLSQEIGKPGGGHRALDDAQAARELFLELCDRAGDLPLPLLQQINRLADDSNWPLAGLFRSFEKQRARTAFAGTIGAQLQAKGLTKSDGKFGLLVDAGDLEQQIVAAPELASLDPQKMMRLLEPAGVLAQTIEGYEHRPQQIAMLKAVADALCAGEVLMAEAGTGTGKSLAYLVPAVHVAVAEGKRVVISTNTINLQDQLFDKDIPSLQNVLPFEFRAAILKGRNNYICLRKLHAVQQAGQLQSHEIHTLARVLVWVQSTTSGDKGELFLPTPADRGFWSRLAADSESCLGEACRYFRRGGCFLQRARQLAESSHIIVVNHSLLLADAAMENAVLPEYDYLIVDEAHHLEEATTKQMSFEVSQESVDQELAALTGAYARGRQHGIVEQISATIGPHLDPPERREIETMAIGIAGQAEDVGDAFHALLSQLAGFVKDSDNGEAEYGLRLRITAGTRKQPAWSRLEIEWDNVDARLKTLMQSVERARTFLRAMDEKMSLPAITELLRDINARADFWKQVREEAGAILTNPKPNRVEWIDVQFRTDACTLHSAPLHVGNLVRQYLIDRHTAVVLTSATLRAASDFAFLRERLGIDDGRELAVDSPFDYEKSTLVYYPVDMPEPAAPFYQRNVCQAIEQVVGGLHGRTLALFTSYRQLRSTVEEIGPALSRAGITVLEQGEGGSRAQLLDKFRSGENVVLFGTRSFWEGVDVVGAALSCVIIVRIPFTVPSEPIFAARCETFEDPFNEYAVPEAVLRFRQGFGRLIRSKNDRGAIIVLDKRILSKQYGQAFVRALPRCTTERGPIANMAAHVVRWVNG